MNEARKQRTIELVMSRLGNPAKPNERQFYEICVLCGRPEYRGSYRATDECPAGNYAATIADFGAGIDYLCAHFKGMQHNFPAVFAWIVDVLAFQNEITEMKP